MIIITCDGVSQSVCRQLLESLLISEEPVDVLVNNGGLWGPGLGTGGWPLQNHSMESVVEGCVYLLRTPMPLEQGTKPLIV